ncbi:NBAS subunit of NRZ tethering complex-like [Oratosquilla oratoria]|uniref:NBAS subunit of NRZ tethering complex-like n=1 Tax=Oratosquilla oratoria TaxID=337810 RepID=UPI003F761245
MATPEDVMMDVVRFLVSAWQGEPTIEIDTEGLDLLEALSHVLKELKGYLQDGGDMLSEEEVMDELRPICENKDLSISTRVEILKVIEKHLALSSEDQQLISVMRTGNVVALAWKDVDVSAIDPEELATADGRNTLLESLIAQTNEEKQAQALVTLLQLWPNFEEKVYSSTSSNPWIKVCDKLLQLVQYKHISKQEVLELVWHVSKESSGSDMLGSECIFWLLERLQGCGIKVIKYSTKVALLSDDSVLHEKVIEDLKKLEKLEEGDCDEEMLTAFVTRNLVTKILPTVFYGPLVSHLNESDDKELLRSAVNQLQNGGYEREAASLVFSSSSLPRSLCTISSALATYSKWM